MQDMQPSAEQLALWAAEQVWDWRVRALFAAVCVAAVIATLIVYLVWERGNEEASSGRARTYTGRIAVTLAVIAAGEALFFKEPVSTILLLATAIAIGLVGLSLPHDGASDPESEPMQ